MGGLGTVLGLQSAGGVAGGPRCAAKKPVDFWTSVLDNLGGGELGLMSGRAYAPTATIFLIVLIVPRCRRQGKVGRGGRRGGPSLAVGMGDGAGISAGGGSVSNLENRQNWIRLGTSENWIQKPQKKKAISAYHLWLSEYTRQDSNL